MTKLSDTLKARLETLQDHETLDILVYIADAEAASDTASLEAEIIAPDPLDNEPVVGRREKVDLMREHVEKLQNDFLSFLQEWDRQEIALDTGISVPAARLIDRYWINNSLRVEVTRDILQTILNRDDVEHVELVVEVDPSDLLDMTAFQGALPLPLEVANEEASKPGTTWSVKRVGAPLMWALGHRGKGVVVAVIDMGVNYKHPDLTQQMWSSEDYPNHGYDFSGSGDTDPIETDSRGHGSACAGIVAGDGTSGRATGVAPEAKIMAIKIGSNQPAIFRCLEFAVDQGADVISMSLTWKSDSSPDNLGWRRACERVAQAGVAHANSSGNQGNNLVRYPLPKNIGAPGNCPSPWLNPKSPQIGGTCSVTTCGSSNAEDELRENSGRGPVSWEGSAFGDYPYDGGEKPGLVKPDICAPGSPTHTCSYHYSGDGSISSAYRTFSGTSAATPHLAGCFALLLSACKAAGVTATPAKLQEAVEETAIKMIGQTIVKENHYGAGRLDVYAAYQYGVKKGWWPQTQPEALSI